MLKIQVSPFIKNIISTSIVSVTATLSLVFVTRILAKGLGPEEFGAYSLARRFISTAVPFALLSMGVSLRRFVAMSTEEKSYGAHIFTAIITIGTILTALLAVSLFAGKHISIAIFQDEAYLNLYYASVLFISCYCFWVITSSSLFGLQQIQKANLLQLFIGGVFPLLISVLFAETRLSVNIITYIGLGHLICLCVLIPELLKANGITRNSIKSSFF